VSGSQSRAAKFSERWTLALDGPDEQPWRITAVGAPAGRPSTPARRPLTTAPTPSAATDQHQLAAAVRETMGGRRSELARPGETVTPRSARRPSRRGEAGAAVRAIALVGRAASGAVIALAT
jgi:hypothetical protein